MPSINDRLLGNLNTDGTARLVTGLVGLVMAALLAQLIWANLALFRYQPEQETSRNNPSRETTQITNYRATDITQHHLFGQAATDGTLVIPETGLQLVLRGAFTSSSPDKASAIIETPNGQTNSYRINSTVFGQAKLHQVHGDRIVLSRNGELETLYFPKKPQQSRSTTQGSNVTDSYSIPSNIQQLVQDNLSAEEIQQASRELTNSSLTEDQRQALIRKRLQDLRERARQKRQSAAASR